jgi:peptide/nickel transport system substrate-binding protein
VRRAVHWAIDKDKLAATATAGLAVPGASLLSPAQAGWRWEVPEAGQYRYDPLRAKRILEDAGYADRDGDGVREDAAARPLSFRLVAFGEHPEDQAAARMMVRWCRDVGIDLRLEVRDEAGFDDDLYARADFDAVIRGRDGGVDPGVALGAFTTARIGDGSETRYSDPLYDSLYVAQKEALDPAAPEDTTRRKKVTDAMQKLLYRDDPSIALWYEVNLQAYRTDAWTGYALAPKGAGAPFWNQLRATYLALRPLRAVAPEQPGPAVLPWVVAGALAVAAAGLALWLRRRRKPGATG